MNTKSISLPLFCHIRILSPIPSWFRCCSLTVKMSWTFNCSSSHLLWSGVVFVLLGTSDLSFPAVFNSILVLEAHSPWFGVSLLLLDCVKITKQMRTGQQLTTFIFLPNQTQLSPGMNALSETACFFTKVKIFASTSFFDILQNNQHCLCSCIAFSERSSCIQEWVSPRKQQRYWEKNISSCSFNLQP